MNLEQLRAMRKNTTSNLTRLTAELQKQDSGKKEDDRFWKLEGDAAGNGSAVIRFLPAVSEGELPWVKMYTHGFKGPSGKWYIENCRTTLGESDPCVDHCNTLWNTGLESDKKIARERKRRLSYMCNVLIVSDPKNPHNEGQVKIFKFGAKIFDKIKDKLQPTFEDEQPVDVFNPFEGANFRLRMRKVEGYANFDKSEFDSIKPISDDDEEILSVMQKRHDIQSFVAPSQFKSYDELKKKLDMVLGSGTVQSKAADFILEDEEDTPAPKAAKPAPKEKAAPAPAVSKKASTEEDDDMSFFEDLIGE